MRKDLLLLIIAAMVIGESICYKIQDFEGGIFQFKPKDGLYEVDIGFGSETSGELLVAYLDLNDDSHTDVITLNEDQRSLKIYTWNADKKIFELYQQMNEGKIASVITGDYNHDGLIDLLITFEYEEYYQMSIYFQTEEKKYNFSDEEFAYVISEQIAKIQPTIVDISGKHETNILYTSLEGTRKIVRYNISNDEKFTFTKFSDYIQEKNEDYSECLDYTSLGLGQISSPHFNSLTDYNGDCKSDFVITSETKDSLTTHVEFYYFLENGKFCLQKVLPIVNLKAMTFSDIDFDGSIDLVFMTQDKINIYFNKFAKDSDKLCELQTDAFPYDNEDASHFTTYPLSIFAALQNFSLFEYNKNFPGMLRINDVEADGYPDLLITVYDPKQSASSKLIQLVNQECSESFCASQHNRYFEYKENSDFQLIEKYQTVWGAYFDFAISKGSLDYLITGHVNGVFKVIGIYNYLNPDTFFLKALSTNGQNNYGAYYYGAAFQCIVTTLSGGYIISTTTQQSQSGYCALNLPYAFIGLGRTNNYVEEFHIGMPQKGEHSKSWTPIIPNSQLMINPSSQSVSEWSISIFVNPTKATLVIIFSTLCILIILGGVIIYLHKKEKEEDKKSQESFYEMFR